MRRPTHRWDYACEFPGTVWPAVPSAAAAGVLSLLLQLERSEWLSAERLAGRQQEQLDVLLEHAYRTVPWYRERWPAAPRASDLPELPLLSRRDVQDGFRELHSRSAPPEHGVISEASTSGSTGAPVRVARTAIVDLMWRALTLRDHRWHGRDLSGTLAAIRRGIGRGSSPSWGAATDGLVATGPCLTLDVDVGAAGQLEWLVRHAPAYLLTYPSLAAELARLSIERRRGLPGLLEVRTLGESLDEDVRSLCREAWGVPLTDVYSADEVGYIALQCPDHEHYHVQAESVLVEVLDERGAPCEAGQTGRVVVTDLHNFAMPLVRYDIGDYAEVGEPCPCGRGLPVLKRIAGRVRNMLVTPQGARFWPSSGLRKQTEVPKLRQYQFVQKAPDLLEAKMVVSQPLSAAEEEYLLGRIRSRLPQGIRVAVRYVESIPRSAGGKYEEFVCEVPRG